MSDDKKFIKAFAATGIAFHLPVHCSCTGEEEGTPRPN